MPTFWEIERAKTLEPGKSFVGLFKPTDEVSTKETAEYGTRYVIRFLGENGQIVKLSGGARLYDAIAGALEEAFPGKKPEEIPAVKLRITAHGKRGTTESGFSAEVVS